MNSFHQARSHQPERGQVIILYALLLPVLLMFVAMAIDVGLAYITKAKLAKAVDAACLTGMRNLSLGQSTAQTLAVNSFNANYRVTSLDSAPPILTLTFTTDANGQVLLNANAVANIRTFFMAVVPERRTLTIGDTAQATRGKLIMSLILDRSGSMNDNGGGAALPTAVTTFINYFDNAHDEVAMVTFASNTTVDVPMEYQFISPITTAAKALKGNFAGGTFGPGGLVVAKSQIDSVPVVSGQNVVKVAVYFTDGWVNIIQDTFNCASSLGATLYNYGGYDSGSAVDFFNPSNGTDWGGLAGNVPPHQPLPNCDGVTRFLSQIDGKQKSFTRSTVTADAQYRALQTATAMRTEGIVVYSIGLGTDVDQTFLKQIANDPGSPTYDVNQPQGLAAFAPSCPSSTCTAQLQQVFQTIASKILLRLTQ